MQILRSQIVRSFALTLAVALAAAPVAQAVTFAAPATGDVRGTVVTSADGAAVENVVVRLVDIETGEVVAEAVSDADGTVSFAAVPFGTYHVVADGPEGFAGSAGPLVTLGPGSAESELSIGLVQGNEPVEGKAVSVDGQRITLADGTIVQVDSSTQWPSAGLTSLEDLTSQLEDHDEVCLSYVGTPQPDGSILASRVEARVCGISPTAAALIAAAAGAAIAGITIAVTQEPGGEEVITQ